MYFYDPIPFTTFFNSDFYVLAEATCLLAILFKEANVSAIASTKTSGVAANGIGLHATVGAFISAVCIPGGKAFVSPLLRVEVSSEVADRAVGPFGRGISVAHDSLSIAYTVIASMLIVKIVRHAKVVTHFMCCDHCSFAGTVAVLVE